MTVYLLAFDVSLDTSILPGFSPGDGARRVSDALRQAADELDECADWRAGVWPNGDACPIDVVPAGDTLSDDDVRAAVREKFGLQYLTVGDVKWTKFKYMDVDFPEWAVPALANGEPLERASDINDYVDWARAMRSAGYSLVDFDVLGYRNEFCSHPAFGLGCATEKIRFFRKQEE